MRLSVMLFAIGCSLACAGPAPRDAGPSDGNQLDHTPDFGAHDAAVGDLAGDHDVRS